MLDNLTMDDELIIQIATLIILPISILLEVVFLCFTLYLKAKKLELIEDTLEDGRRFYSLNFFFSGVGVLHYATIFLSAFHAKRYGLFEKRDLVPKHVQRLFIINFSIFMVAFFLMFGSALIVHLLQ